MLRSDPWFFIPFPHRFMPTYCVTATQAEYKKAYIDAESPERAEQIARASLLDARDDVDWDVFDDDVLCCEAELA